MKPTEKQIDEFLSKKLSECEEQIAIDFQKVSIALNWFEKHIPKTKEEKFRLEVQDMVNRRLLLEYNLPQ